MSEGWADFAPGDETVAWSKAEVVAEAMTREVPKARRLDPNSRVVRPEERAKVAVAVAAEWKKGSEGGCISKRRTRRRGLGKDIATSIKHHAINTSGNARRSRIRMLTVCVGVQEEKSRSDVRSCRIIRFSVAFLLRAPF
jgi:hypothetical protein